MTQHVTAPEGEKPDRTRVTKPLMDYSSLSAEDTGAPITGKSDPYRNLAGTPFEADVLASYESGTAKSYTVKSDDIAQQVGYLLGLAARKNDLGLRLPKPFARTANGVVVTFQARDKKSVTRKG